MFVRTLALSVATAVVSAGLMVPTQAPAQAAPDRYSPKPGVTFNNPTGSGAARREIFRKVMRSINSSPRGSNIYIFSWNFLTSEGREALLRAQRRGVQVKILMDSGNDEEINNQPWRNLKAGLRKGNRGRPHKRHSWARVCHGSCRGHSGSAHSKFFMFSQAGRTKRVVMQGSANFTLASTNNQWNDIYTHVRNPAVWKFYLNVFRQAAKDRAVRHPFAQLKTKSYRLMVFPDGKAPDPVRQLLNNIKCRGATNTASGRTVMRIAPDVLRKDRGMALAQKIRSLWQHGCDVKVGYTVVGVQIGRMLRAQGGRGPVPMKHLVQDFDGDGEFDNYFHLKSMSVRGWVGKDRSNTVTLNGSANWSGLAAVSDENLGIYWSKKITDRYQKHLEYWYTHFPRSNNDNAFSGRAAIDSDRLIFGFGKHAIYEDGESVSDGEFNPFAKMQED